MDAHEERCENPKLDLGELFGRALAVLTVLAVIGIGLFFWWRTHQESLAAAEAARKADENLPTISARELFDAYARDKTLAIAKYSGKRYFIWGKGFDSMALDVGKPTGMVKLTAGTGGSDDTGERFVVLYSTPDWATALSTLKTGTKFAAACTVDPSGKGLAAFTEGTLNVGAFDCTTVITGIGEPKKMPFAEP